MKGAAQTLVVAGVLATMLGVAAGRASAADVTDADRTWANFMSEAATVGDHNARLEVRGMTLEDQGGNRLNIIGLRLRSLYPKPQFPMVNKLTGGEIDLLGSFGIGNNGEVGFLVPGLWQSLQFKDQAGNANSGKTLNEQDVGDLQLYTKIKHSVAEHCSVAGGVELDVPNGSKDKGFTTGETGVTPFVSTRYQRGPYALGANIGYQIYSGSPVDVFHYGVEGIIRASENWNFRTELRGRVFTEAGHTFDALELMPGIDYNLSENITLRPEGMAGLTNSAIDWGVGGALAYTFPLPHFSMPEAPPPPPAVAEAPPPVPTKEKIVLRGVHFDFNKANIRADAKPILDQAAAALKEQSSVDVTVEGHTDNIGSDAYNQKLSVRRAEAVRDYLAGQGVATSRMTVVGKGESAPVASNDTEDGRAQNRRVELLVKE